MAQNKQRQQKEKKECWSNKPQACLSLLSSHHSSPFNVKAAVVVFRNSRLSRPGKLTTLQLYSSSQIDQNTGRGKLSEERNLKEGKNTKHGSIPTITYRVSFSLCEDFGVLGAIQVKNGDRNEFFLHSVTVMFIDDLGNWSHKAQFDCRSWVYPVRLTNVGRLFFSITSYLPRQTPEALQKLRQEELVCLRGNGRGERKEWERIYDYAYYNDLGDPSKGIAHERPVLGGSKSYPYPRRIRTGRPLSDKDHQTEERQKIINLDFYVPPDERFSPTKLSEFISSSIQAVIHFVLPELTSLLKGSNIINFESFDQISKDLYTRRNVQSRQANIERIVLEKLKEFLPEDIFKEVIKIAKNTTTIKFPIPQVIEVDQFAWKTDEEFAREMLAGLNPVVIKRLESFPPVGKDGRQSSILPTHIQNNLDGLTINQAMDQKRIFILDHHDYLMPYLRRINMQGECIYASRTLLLRRDNGTLKPLVIELSSPEEEGIGLNNSRVFLPATNGIDGALWQLAKTHVSINDSGYHQLISHWLHTHAVVEPFIIATRRQLSTMHPIHKLLDPHFKDTMHINSLARSILLNAGGILEKTMFPAKFSMELSSTIYEDWRFEDQQLPFDLLKRGMAVYNPSHRAGIQLLIEDYPYATDGLDVWFAINSWVTAFCSHFYASDADVVDDIELRSWWSEIRLIGHGDLPIGSLRPNLDSLPALILSLTTLIWIASALHAAVNFGQYAYAGFPPARPTRSRRFIPVEGSLEFANLVHDPDQFFMETIPDRFTATLGVALVEVLSRHAREEVYLGRRAAEEWTDDVEVVRLFAEFGEELRKVEKRIEERNGDLRLLNRRGPIGLAYTLMYPDIGNDGSKEKGITSKGIPNSVSI
ncbi:linoleate 9S-lipoxygenase 6 [Dendrobium catenatum]|nr:linoleate 9S-lipoxygenase 6 [Dendrobium catenatum]